MTGHHSLIWSSHQLHESMSCSAWQRGQKVTECNKVPHCRHAFWKKKDVRQYSQYSPWVHTQVKRKSTCWFSMSPLGTVVLYGRGVMGAHGQSFANPATWCSPNCPVWWKSNIDSAMFQMTGAVRVVRLSVKWTFFKNMYNTLQSNVLILPHKFPMITSLKHSESFSWDIIIQRPVILLKGPCMFKSFMDHAILSSLNVFVVVVVHHITTTMYNNWT